MGDELHLTLALLTFLAMRFTKRGDGCRPFWISLIFINDYYDNMCAEYYMRIYLKLNTF